MCEYRACIRTESIVDRRAEHGESSTSATLPDKDRDARISIRFKYYSSFLHPAAAAVLYSLDSMISLNAHRTVVTRREMCIEKEIESRMINAALHPSSTQSLSFFSLYSYFGRRHHLSAIAAPVYTQHI